MATVSLLKRPEKAHPCVVVIGMAGSGKSTVGNALAKALDFAFLDTDHLMEAAYGVPLQSIVDELTPKEFLELESRFVCSLRVGRAVVSTGGSVVYSPDAMHALGRLGSIVCLDAPLEVIEERIAMKPDRGLAIAEGQTIADLYNERKVLYDRYAQIHCDTTRPIDVCVRSIVDSLPEGVKHPE